MLIKIVAIVIGWLLGMIINYLSDVLPVKHRLSIPTCTGCNNEFEFFNYLFWPRRCTLCRKPRSMRVWIVEILMGGTAFLLVDYYPPELSFGLSLLLFGFLLLVTIIDIEHRLILHIISLFGAVLGLVIGIRLHGIIPTLIGGATGFCVMLILYYLGLFFIRFSRKIRGEQITEDEAIGFGDVNLSGVIGLILGWPGIAAGLILAILVAGIVSLLYLAWIFLHKEYHPNLSLPYGPFLTLSAFLLIFIRPFFF